MIDTIKLGHTVNKASGHVTRLEQKIKTNKIKINLKKKLFNKKIYK